MNNVLITFCLTFSQPFNNLASLKDSLFCDIILLEKFPKNRMGFHRTNVGLKVI